MKVLKTADYNEMSRKAANIIAAQVITKPDCVLGLATGSSPIGTYKELIKMYENGDLDFSQVKSVNLDEYKGLPRENDQSYYYFMNDNFFNHINIDKANTNVPNGMEPDAEKECARYEELIKSCLLYTSDGIIEICWKFDSGISGRRQNSDSLCGSSVLRSIGGDLWKRDV